MKVAGAAISACLLTLLLDAFTVVHSLSGSASSAICMYVWLTPAHCSDALLLLLGASLALAAENPSETAA